MPIFRIEGERLRKLAALPLDRERTLQRLIEANLGEALGLRFLDTEYVTTSGGRIDTLAVDEAGSPVIIEYKRNSSESVINQALFYLKWLKTQKREFFEKLLADRLGDAAPVLDWSQPRVICVAERYNRFDLATVEVVPLRIELFEYRLYEDGILSLERVSGPTEPAPSPPAAASRPARIERHDASSDATTRTAALLAVAEPATHRLFDDLREWLLALDQAIEERVTSIYFAYRLGRNFTEVSVRRAGLRLLLMPVDYIDPHKMVERIPDSHRWTLNRRISVNDEAQLEQAKPIIEQSYRAAL